MADRNRRLMVEAGRKAQRKHERAPVSVQFAEEWAGLEQPARQSMNALGATSITDQAGRMGDTRLGTAQRRTLVTSLGRTLGNRSLQRVLANAGQRANPDGGMAPSRPGAIGASLPAHVQGSAPALAPATPASDSNTIQRWAEEEHKSFGDLAAQMAMKHDWSFKVGGETIVPMGVGAKSDATVKDKKSYHEFITEKVDPLKKKLKGRIGKGEFAEGGIGVAHHQEVAKYVHTPEGPVPVIEHVRKNMSFGDATMLGGDYFKTAEGGTFKTAGLKEAQSVHPEEQAAGKMYYVAATNTSHFFPLAAKEWITQHAQAIKYASDAHKKYSEGNKSEGDSNTEKALRYLGVAAHFLQDTFASGHQYPRALDDIDSLTAMGVAMEGLGPAKTYHDALCALRNGLPMQYGGGRRFHGDYTATASDSPVVTESYRALVNLLSIIKTGKGSSVKATYNPGPDVPAIMSDAEAGPIWSAMVEHLRKGKLEKGRKAAKAGKAGYTTSAGTSYSAKEVMDAWEGLGGDVRKPTTQVDKLMAAALKGQQNLLHTATKEGNLGPGMSTDRKADDEIRSIIEAGGVPKLTHNQAVTILPALISGVCGDEDEQAVLKILKAQSDAVFRSTVNTLTPNYIDSGVDGEEWDTFLLLCASKYRPGSNVGASLIASEKNDDAGRMLITGGLCGIPSLVASNRMNRLSGTEWIGVINALLSGSCDTDDEDAIVRIVQYMADTGQAGLVHTMIGASKMDSGVDGKQWGQVREIMRKAGYKWSWWG